MRSPNFVARPLDPELQAVTNWLQGEDHDHFRVTSHVNPDGDGLAGMSVCGRLLRTLGKMVRAGANPQLIAEQLFSE